jgi:RNA polymerase sigma-70 factor, ECF subfamily
MRAEQDSSRAADGQDQDRLARADRQLVERLLEGEAEAGHHFVRQHYPGVYYYLLSLTGCPELAEDLTQETFLQAWRRLDTFAGRAPLRLWLHRIAYREFLQAVRRPRPVVPLEEVADVQAPEPADWAGTMLLQAAIRKLSPDQQQVVTLHYLQGYDCQEIGQIMGAPAGTVKYWLSLARIQLQRELGEGDLSYLNEAVAPMRQWAWLPLDQMQALETRLGFSDIVPIAARPEETMERREFLRQAAVGAAGLILSETEKEVVDRRLTQKVTCTFKATALSDLCEKLKVDTGIRLSAGASVADEKVTLFCRNLPLRDVMRQLSRPFGYTWLRSGKPEDYRYELAQDLRSQLLEEELRNRDRNAALLALEQEMSGYRRYLDLSPDQALARARSASPEEKRRLEQLASSGWGPLQLYFRLSPQDQAILRSGQGLTFAMDGELAGKVPGLIGGAGVRPLPPELRQGALQSLRDRRVVRRDGNYQTAPADDPGGIPLTAAPEAQPIVTLELHESELGQFTLDGHSGFAIPNQNEPGKATFGLSSQGPYASGRSPAVLQPNNRKANAKLAGDPALRARVSLQPRPSCGAPREAGVPSGPAAAGRKVTPADVLEAIHQATGRPVIGDSFTRLYPLEMAAVRDQSLFDALNQVADVMHLRWAKDDTWLQFRSSSYYNDRLKEVPNRLLARWSASRRQHGELTLDDLLEIAQLSDVQLAARDMAEGARDCWGLAEWDLARNGFFRPHLHYLAQLTPAQRQAALAPNGLAFAQMSLAQQQQFISLRAQNIRSLEELTGATLRVGYTHAGEFQWAVPEGDLPGRGAIGLSPVQERTREAALQAARRVDPQVDPAQITPTELALTIVYTLGSPRTGVRQSSLQVTPVEVRVRGHDYPPSGGTVPPHAGS